MKYFVMIAALFLLAPAHAELGKIKYLKNYKVGGMLETDYTGSYTTMVEMYTEYDVNGEYALLTVQLPNNDQIGNPMFVKAVLSVNLMPEMINDFTSAIYTIAYDPDNIVYVPAPCLGEEYVYPNPDDPSDVNGVCYVVTNPYLIKYKQ